MRDKRLLLVHTHTQRFSRAAFPLYLSYKVFTYRITVMGKHGNAKKVTTQHFILQVSLKEQSSLRPSTPIAAQSSILLDLQHSNRGPKEEFNHLTAGFITLRKHRRILNMNYIEVGIFKCVTSKLNS